MDGASRGGRWRRRTGQGAPSAAAAAPADDCGFWDEPQPAPAAEMLAAAALAAAEVEKKDADGLDFGLGRGGQAPSVSSSAAAARAGRGEEAAANEREEEQAVLEAIYGAEFEALSPNEWRVELPGPLGAPRASLQLLLPEDYPGEAPPVPVVNSDSHDEALQAAAAEVVQELLGDWQPGTEGCAYQWAERIREALRPLLEEAAGVAAAKEAQLEELVAAEAEVEEDGRAQKGFEYLPANPQYGQRRRNFDERSFDEANAVEVKQGEPFTDRKSTFQAHAAKVTSQGQVQWVLRTLLSDRRVAAATHNIFAYRFNDSQRGALIADNDDDGEDTAGTKLAELLALAGCEDVFVMVSRWYGGIQLGSDRFKHICRAASTLLDGAGWSRRGRTGGGGGAKTRGSRR